MTDNNERKLTHTSLLIAAGLSCFYVLAYITAALLRMRYPFELQWIEGPFVDHVNRILAGMPIYQTPSMENVPMIYTPLYYQVSAAVTKLIGGGFYPLRLVSFACSLGSMFVIYKFVRGEGYGVVPALCAVGLFAATYRLTTGWFDIARVDSMYLFFALCSLYALRFERSPWGLTAAGVLAFAAFQTKQSAAVISIPMALYAVIVYRARAVWFIATAFGLIAASVVWMNHATNGWFSYYVFHLPSEHPIVREKLLSFWFGDLLPALTIAVIVSAAYLFLGIDRQERRKSLFYLFATVSMFGISLSGRLHSGGFVNVVMPAYAWIAVLFGLGIGWIVASGESRARTALIALSAVQFAVLVYNPMSFVPTRADYLAGQKLLRIIESADGGVFIPFHPYLAVEAGKPTYLHRMTFSDIIRSHDMAERERITGDIEEAIREQRFDMIILDDWWMRDMVSRNYRCAGPVFDESSVFWPKTGLQKRPEYIYVRRGDRKAYLLARESK